MYLNRRSLLKGSAHGVGAAVIRNSGQAAPASDAPPVATTTAGKVRGYLDDGIAAFKGIPYGGDTALRRFQLRRCRRNHGPACATPRLGAAGSAGGRTGGGGPIPRGRTATP